MDTQSESSDAPHQDQFDECGLLGDASSSSRLKQKHVMQVYDQIAHHFSDTRHSPWPKVKDFLVSLPDYSLVYDVGCGNGKYGKVNPKVIVIGGDTSENLLSICREQNKLEPVVSDATRLPFRTESGDHCISIAVVHHLPTPESRAMCLKEMGRILKPGGTGLVYVWAFEQKTKEGEDSKYLRGKRDPIPRDESTNDGNEFHLPVHQNRTPFQSQDVLVPWNLKESKETFLRYYHVFKQGELEEMVQSVPGLVIVSSYFDQGNWCLVFRKENI